MSDPVYTSSLAVQKLIPWNEEMTQVTELDNETRSAIEWLQTNISNLLTVNAHALARTEELGKSGDFSECVPAIEKILELFRRLRESDLHILPADLLKSLADEAAFALREFDAIRTYTRSLEATAGDPSQKREGLIEAVRNRFSSCFRALTPVLVYSTLIKYETDDSLENSRLKLIELQQLLPGARDKT